ncbi:hypothetical protein POPTR_014G083100v4 [Populus trichocarpa]|uniref:Uncharacterized protein n=1 Tax=Populus trichocarpa TaxID=3694 RepID=B9I8I5_POPTR|nr:uncharacterized protein LOC7464928 isoform X1 [Populus trichocarpa]PNT03675.1 hypothetical protein POPTR_014G083100v4 [Populus trichocarpa]|eukprot:XP_002320129.1 uncharacterized protein LOC7464928 isoform X1 [Populus trichocarpa]
MSSNNPTEIIRSPEKWESRFEEEEEEVEKLEKLETEVKQMAKKILEYRTTLPDQLKTTVASLLSSQRPVLRHFDSGSDPGSSGELNPDSGGQDTSSRAALLTEEDRKTAEKTHLLKEKISSNVSAMPVVLKRMEDCISKIDKLYSYNGSIHPAFKKKRTS